MADSPKLAEAAATGDLGNKDIINLLVGHASARLFPNSTLEQFYETTLLSPPPLHERDRHLLTYGPDAGQYTVRRSLSNYLRACYEIQKDWTEEETENLIITGGASSTLGEIFKRCTDTKTNVIVVEPTYFLVGGILEDAGFSLEGNASGNQKVYGVTWLSEDTDLAGSIRSLITSTSFTPTGPRYQTKPTRHILPAAYPTEALPLRLFDWVIYLVPTYSNPTGLTLPPAQREALVRLAREFNGLIVTDDVYDLLPYTVVAEGEFPATPPLRLVDHDRLLPGTLPGGNTLSNGSFSKILGPGLRVGWLESACPTLVSQISQSGVIKSGGSMGHFNSCIIRQMLLKRAVDIPVLSQLMMTYKFRAGALTRAIGRHLPKGTTILGGRGGYFFYIGLGPESDSLPSDEIARLAKQEGVIVLPGSACMLGGTNGGRWVRIAVCYEEKDQIVEGIKRLGKACERYYRDVLGREMEIDEELAKIEEPVLKAVPYEQLVPPVQKTNRRKRAKAEKEKAAAAAAAAAAEKEGEGEGEKKEEGGEGEKTEEKKEEVPVKEEKKEEVPVKELKKATVEEVKEE